MVKPLTDEPDDVFAPGASFGRYVIGPRIGRGGMGMVYEATHLGLGKKVAIKVLLPEAARNAEGRARFVREGETAARLRHPHVVDISDVGVHDGLPFIVMELLEGEDLATLLRREGALPLDHLVGLMLPVLDGVAAAHAAGVIHRDLKPENIFLARTRLAAREPKILDFGISKLTDLGALRGLTETNTLMGTAHYVSPEQAQNSKDVDARTDQYSLGVMLYECATGQQPFALVRQEDSLYKLLQAIVQGDFAPPRALYPSLPEGFEDIVLRAMATRRRDRFPSVQALAHALLPYATPAARLTWEPLVTPAVSVAEPLAAVLPSPDPAPPIVPSVQDTFAGVGPRIPTLSESPTAVSPRTQPDLPTVLAHEAPRADTFGTTVRPVHEEMLPRASNHGRWMLFAAAVVPLALGSAVAIMLYKSPPPVVATLPRSDTTMEPPPAPLSPVPAPVHASPSLPMDVAPTLGMATVDADLAPTAPTILVSSPVIPRRPHARTLPIAARPHESRLFNTSRVYHPGSI